MKNFEVYVNVDADKFILEVLDGSGDVESSFAMDVHEARILHNALSEALPNHY